ncbi:MAG: tetratricopeptide repeat protein, partial [Lentisphaeria bacterium]|nr:tetratricopeptide repeat protein [Lentisphaeria bacterium]
MARAPKDKSGSSVPQAVQLEEGWVDRLGEHFTLTCDNVGEDSSRLVARLAPVAPNRGVLEFLIDSEDASYAEVREAVLELLNFFLVEKEEPNPWQYFRYHCGTTANVYSRVHVGYRPANWVSEEVRSSRRAVEPEAVEAAKRHPTARKLGDARRRIVLFEEGEVFHLLDLKPVGDPTKAEGDATPGPTLHTFRSAETRTRFLRQKMPELGSILDDEAAAAVALELPGLQELVGNGKAEEALPRLYSLHDRLLGLAGGGLALLQLASCEQVTARAEYVRGEIRQATNLLRESLGHIGWAASEGHATPARPLRVQGLTALGQLVQETGQFGKALPLLTAALEDAEMEAVSGGPDGTDRLGALLINLGDALHDQGDPDQAVVLYERAVKILAEVIPPSDTSERVHALLGTYERLGDAALVGGDFEKAMTWYRQYLDRAVALPAHNDEETIARSTSICGACSRLTDACLQREDLEGAERYSSHGMEAIAAHFSSEGRDVALARADVRNRRARLALARGQFDEAADLAVQAAEGYDRLAETSGRGDDLLQLALHWHDAARHLRAAGRDATTAWARALKVAKELKQMDPDLAGIWEDIKKDSKNHLST